MMWYWGGGVYWWEWLLGFVGMVVFWGLVIWAIWYFATSVLGRREQAKGPAGHRDAKQILDERLARGDIDADEYRRLRDLMGSAQAHTPDGRAAVGGREQH